MLRYFKIHHSQSSFDQKEILDHMLKLFLFYLALRLVLLLFILSLHLVFHSQIYYMYEMSDILASCSNLLTRSLTLAISFLTALRAVVAKAVMLGILPSFLFISLS